MFVIKSHLIDEKETKSTLFLDFIYQVLIKLGTRCFIYHTYKKLWSLLMIDTLHGPLCYKPIFRKNLENSVLLHDA